MGLALTQVITEDRSSGGQVIDGSLRFDSGNSTHLTRTPGSAGNRRTWTFSCWVKLGSLSQGERGTIFQSSGGPTIYQDSGLRFAHAWDPAGTDYIRETVALFRDPSAWYHVVWWCDTTQSGTRWKIYVNGVEQTLQTPSSNNGEPAQNTDLGINSTDEHTIGEFASYSYLDGYLSQAYFVDGQAFDASYFGYTDPLTNTWRPKKYTGTYGTNGFYLPMDGNSLIGEDKSGNGNNFTPVNFGGSNTIEKATGAFPILNTVNGGRVATAGIRTDAYASNLVLALPLNGNANDVSNQINSGSTTKTITVTGANADSSTSVFYGGSYHFDGVDDGLRSDTSSDFTLGTGAFTIECWFNRDNTTDNYESLISDNIYNAAGGWNLYTYQGEIRMWKGGSQIFSVPGAYSAQTWNHVAVQRDTSGNWSCYINGIDKGVSANDSVDFTNDRVCIGANNLSSSYPNYEYGGYIQDLRIYKGVAKYTSNFIPASTNPDILPDTPSGVAGGSALTKITDGSVSFDGASDSLTFTSTSDVSLDGDFTIEFWAYPNTIVNDTSDPSPITMPTDGSAISQIYIHTTNFNYTLHKSSAIVSTGNNTAVTNRWQHVAFTRSGTTVYAFFDGVLQNTATSSATLGGTSGTFRIGSFTADNGNYDGFMSNVRIIKGTALYTANFTPPTRALTNVTNTKLLCCQTYTDRTAAAVSPGTITGNGNAQANTFNPFTTDIDSVRGQESGYATLNPVSFRGNGSITDGNLTMAANSSGDCCAAVTLQIPTDKKIYLEAQHNVTAGAGNRAQIGVVNVNVDTGAMARPGDAAGGWAYDFSTSSGNSGAYDEGTRTAGPPVDNGDICMWCIDLSAGLMWAGKNGQWFSTGNPSTGSGAVITGIPDTATGLKVSVDGGASNRSELIYNFGQKPFKYNPPDGFEPLCLANLSRPTNLAAVRPEAYVGVHTYVGTGSEHDIPNAFGFDPDFLWTRRSDATGDRHNWYDKVRGDDGTRMYVICPDATTSQATRTEATTAMVRSSQWPRHGFRVGTNGQTNTSGALYTAFGLKAGGAPVSNTDGSITTQVSASPESGFSIIGYTGNQTTGASIGHGLNQAPEMLIFKSLSETRNWLIWHKDLNGGRGDYTLQFNALKRALDSRTDRPLKDTGCTTATTIILGLDSEVNHNNEMICYAFHSVPGVVKVGKYDGNGSTTDGPFVDCGFRPKFVIAKNYAGGSETNWFVKDAENAKFNPAQFTLYLNNSDARVNNFPVDFYSNGFKLRDDNALINESGSNYIYIAWADTPTQTLYGGQANAR